MPVHRVDGLSQRELIGRFLCGHVNPGGIWHPASGLITRVSGSVVYTTSLLGNALLTVPISQIRFVADAEWEACAVAAAGRRLCAVFDAHIRAAVSDFELAALSGALPDLRAT